MTVLPGSLDYLYYQGILEHIPYEAYEGALTPMPNNAYSTMPSAGDLKKMVLAETPINPMQNNRSNINNAYSQNNSYNVNASQYLDSAKQGRIYNEYNSGDYFVRNPYNTNYSQNTVSVSNNPNYADGVNNFNNIQESKPNFWNRNIKNLSGKKKKMSDSNDPVFGSSPWKGLAALGLIILTPILIIKGFKKH